MVKNFQNGQKPNGFPPIFNRKAAGKGTGGIFAADNFSGKTMRIIPLLVAVALITAILYAPISVPWKVVSIGQVFPRKSWKIAQDATGNLLVNEQDWRTGETSVSSNYQFERGDLVEARLRPGQDSLAPVNRGDTVLAIRTTRIEDRLTTLRGQLAEAKSQLSSGSVGEKPPIVEEAENRLRFAEQEFSNQKTTCARMEQLFVDKNVSAQEVENARNLLRKAEIQIGIEQKSLESARTGLKPADIDVLHSRIQNLAGQISFLEKQTTKYVLTAPFDGLRRRTALPGEVFMMQSAREFFLQIPVKVEDLRWIGPSSKIEIKDVQTGRLFLGKFLDFSPTVEVLSGRRTQMLEAMVETAPGERLNTGLSVDCSIDCGAVNVREYLRRALNFQ